MGVQIFLVWTFDFQGFSQAILIVNLIKKILLETKSFAWGDIVSQRFSSNFSFLFTILLKCLMARIYYFASSRSLDMSLKGNCPTNSK